MTVRYIVAMTTTHMIATGHKFAVKAMSDDRIISTHKLMREAVAAAAAMIDAYDSHARKYADLRGHFTAIYVDHI